MPSIKSARLPGQPTKYSEAKLLHTQEYVERYKQLKTKQPYIEELALELGVDDTTICNWAEATNEDGSRKYPEFFAAIKMLKTLQKFRLLEKTLYQFPTGAIFQLKANHNMIESEKRILQGEKSADPIKIIVTEE